MTFQGLILMLCITASLGMAPPHPSYTDFESVHEMRDRLNITYGYEPQHITHEHCRYLTEEDCREGRRDFVVSQESTASTGDAVVMRYGNGVYRAGATQLSLLCTEFVLA